MPECVDCNEHSDPKKCMQCLVKDNELRRLERNVFLNNKSDGTNEPPKNKRKNLGHANVCVHAAMMVKGMFTCCNHVQESGVRNASV